MDLGDASLGAMGGRWEAAWGGGELRRRLFYAEHQRPSLEQLGIYQVRILRAYVFVSYCSREGRGALLRRF